MSLHRAKILSVERTIAVDAGTTLLLAALEAAIAYPHGCSSGRCGRCKTRLLEGEVDLLPHTPFSLSASEREYGLILACRAQPRSDITVQWLATPAPNHPLIRTPATIVSVSWLTHDIAELRLRPEQPLMASAGQYLRVSSPGLPPRSYSLAPAPGRDEIALHISIVAGGRLSAALAGAATSGLPIMVEGPYGDAYLREDHSGPILMAADGAGLAPILSIVETAVASHMHQPIHVYVGARSTPDVYGTDRLARLAGLHPRLTVHRVLSSPGTTGPHRVGLLHEAIAQDLCAGMKGWKAYVAGPPAMVEALGELCRAQGMRDRDFHAEAFFTVPEPLASGLAS